MPDAPKHYTSLRVKKLPDGEIEIDAEVPADRFETYRRRALAELGRELELPGFRKGKVPMELAEQHLNPAYVLEEAAHLALRDAYPEVVANEKLRLLGAPEATVTKLARGNPLGFRLRATLMPEFKLPDYRKIGREVMATQTPIEVTDAEVEETMTELRKFRANAGAKAGSGAEIAVELPELTDEFVKTLGAFSNVEEFRTKIRGNILEEKTVQATGARREALAARLIETTKFSIPPRVIDAEAASLRDERTKSIERMGLTMEEYLKRAKKTEDEFHADERTYVERQIRTRFILAAIAEAERLAIPEEEVETSLDLLRRRYPDAEPENLRHYLLTMLTNERVLRLLEGEET